MSRSKRKATARQQTEQNVNILGREIMVLHKLFEEHLLKEHGYDIEKVKDFYKRSLSPPPQNVVPQTEPKTVEQVQVHQVP